MKVRTATLRGEPCKITAGKVCGEAWSRYMKPGSQQATLWYDDTQTPSAVLETIIHEALHIQRPNATEPIILRDAAEIARLLWRIGYRLKEPND